MKGIIFDIKHCAIHDGPGIRTTVFFKGCPLKCWWCHNPESISPEIQQIERTRKIGEKIFIDTETLGKEISVDEVMKEIEKDLVFYEESGGGVTFSGGEPLMQAEFVTEIAKKCKESGIHTALDTSGYTSIKLLNKVLPYIDLFLFDIKSLDNNIHKKYTNASNEEILAILEYLKSKDKPIIIRYPLIPEINNTEEQIRKLKEFVKGEFSEIHLLPYHKIANHKYKQLGMENKLPDLVSLSKEYLKRIKQEFEEIDLQVKIGG